MKQLSGVNSQRISERIAELSQIGKMSAGGVTRKALTKEDFEAQRLTAKWMKEAGLTVRTDSFGNLIGRKDGQNPMAPAVIIGSHNEVCRKRGLGLELTEHLLQKPVQCLNRVIQTMKNAAKILELDPPEMISGAGHDAMSISEIAEIGMIFVRCRGGISHNPKEWAEIDDIAKGTSLLLETALQFL